MLDSDGQAALQTWFQSGGVYTGVHSGSACLYNDTNYIQAVGGELSALVAHTRTKYWVASFDYHPQLQSAVSRPYLFGLRLRRC